MRINEIAAAIHADMCNDERNGYSWEERNGGGGQYKTLTLDGKEYTYQLGDRDCSSSVIEAWRLAIQYTEYAGRLDGATYTGNIRSVFVASGLFDVWNTSTTDACTGDLYLNDSNHVAMCQSPANPDTLSEFSWGDVGAYGNKRGDQSGWESHICNFYNYPWDCTLHYNGKADGTKAPASSTPAKSSAPTCPKYRVFRAGKWRAWKTDGQTAGTRADDVYDVDFEGLGAKGWFQLTLADGTVLPRNAHNAGHKVKVIGVTVYYDTPNPGKTGYYEALYRVFTSAGSWLKWEHDDDDDGAGDDVHPIRRFQLKLGKC